MRRFVPSAGLVTIVLVLGACGAAGDPAGPATAGASGASSTASSVRPTTTPIPDPGVGSPGGTDPALVPVTLERTGGLAGVRQRVEVRTDGSYVVSTDGQTARGRLSNAQVRELVRALGEAHLATATTAAPTAQRSDDFTYVVRSQGNAFTSTVPRCRSRCARWSTPWSP